MMSLQDGGHHIKGYSIVQVLRTPLLARDIDAASSPLKTGAKVVIDSDLCLPDDHESGLLDWIGSLMAAR